MAASQNSKSTLPQKRKSKTKLSTIYSTTTIRHMSSTYFHLRLVSPSTLTTAASLQGPPIDLITVRTHITSALSQFLGATGAAIPVDILKVEGRDAWIRVPYEDGMAVTEALNGWIGNDVAWRVKESGCWLGGLSDCNWDDLFGS